MLNKIPKICQNQIEYAKDEENSLIMLVAGDKHPQQRRK